MALPPLISCEHGHLVELREAIVHVGGGYCDSRQFLIAALDRGQAMALLLLAKGSGVVPPGPVDRDPTGG